MVIPGLCEALVSVRLQAWDTEDQLTLSPGRIL